MAVAVSKAVRAAELETPPGPRPETIRRDSFRPIRSEAGDNINIDRQLFLEDDHLDNLEDWVERLLRTVGRTEANLITANELEGLEGQIRALMSSRGLRRVFAAQLVTGAMFTTTGTSGAKEVGDPKKASGVTPSVHVAFESEHFFSHTNGVDFSLGGRFGFQPALTLVREKSDTDPTPVPDPNATVPDIPKGSLSSNCQEAFAWELSPRFNIHLMDTAELSLTATAGQILLIDEIKLIENVSEATLVIPVDNGTSKGELFGEVGVGFRLFDVPLNAIHAEKRQLSPVFEANAGIRWDNRFKRANDLTIFDSPSKRIYADFMINGLTVLDRRDDAADPGRSYGLSFGVDYEASTDGSVPNGTRFLIRGDFDLIQLLSPR